MFYTNGETKCLTDADTTGYVQHYEIIIWIKMDMYNYQA
jgi:hypothetical protein